MIWTSMAKDHWWLKNAHSPFLILFLVPICYFLELTNVSLSLLGDVMMVSNVLMEVAS